MKLVISALITLILLMVTASSVQARVLPRFRSSSAAGSSGGGSPSTVTVSPRFMSGKSGLRVSFNGISNAKKITYMLNYETNGKQEGVAGTITAADGNSTSRDLLFGTCSSGVCRYHEGLKNMKFEVRSDLKNGKTAVRRYRIKI